MGEFSQVIRDATNIYQVNVFFLYDNNQSGKYGTKQNNN